MDEQPIKIVQKKPRIGQPIRCVVCNVFLGKVVKAEHDKGSNFEIDVMLKCNRRACKGESWLQFGPNEI